MEIYTIQISNRHKLPDDIEFIDTTRKSGDERFAPTWEMVMGVKAYKKGVRDSNVISPGEFKRRYRNIIQNSIHDNREFWEAFVQKKKIAIGCYCNIENQIDPFCHRLILKEYLLHLCHLKQIHATDCGEFK